MTEPNAELPPIVDADEWQRALDYQVAREKAHTRLGDALSARRRRLPMMKVETEYRFEGPIGGLTMMDLFAGRRQLIIYHFMFAGEADEGCVGCSWVADAMTHPAHLHARDTSLAVVSRAPRARLEPYRERMGWGFDWYSSAGSMFNVDMGVTVDGEELHGVSVFLRHDTCIYRTYFSGDRGVEHLGSHWTYLDLTPFGRQETWEDSPPGWPQTEPYWWQKRHDEY